MPFLPIPPPHSNRLFDVGCVDSSTRSLHSFAGARRSLFASVEVIRGSFSASHLLTSFAHLLQLLTRLACVGILLIFLSVGEGWGRLKVKADGGVILVKPFWLQVTKTGSGYLGSPRLDLHQEKGLEMKRLQEGGLTCR